MSFLVDEKLKRGDLTCVAALVEGEEGGGAGGGHASVVVREDGGERMVALSSDTVTIGRLADCDVVLKDKGRPASTPVEAARRRVDAHGPGIDERDPPERPDGPIP